VFFAESLETFPLDLRRARPTVFFSVPRLWTKFQTAVYGALPKRRQEILFRVPFVGRKLKRKILEQLGLEDVRLAFTGAAPLPAHTIDWYRGLGLQLLEAYGMSENMAYSHFTRPGEERYGYVGHPSPGVECRIGEGGEVLVKSPAQMMGYFKEPEKTAECYTPDGFFRTGDMGEIDGEGRVRITGRVKDLFKTSKGKYVAPVPIENKLAAHPKLEGVCVCGANQPATLALLLLAEDTRKQLSSDPALSAVLEAEITQLLIEVNASLDPHERLECAVLVREPWSVDDGSLTPTMKIRRNVIEKRYEPYLGRWLEAGKPVIWEGAERQN
jgi:long-subunit acyl-CoA synthetase (AMP-forming)